MPLHSLKWILYFSFLNCSIVVVVLDQTTSGGGLSYRSYTVFRLTDYVFGFRKFGGNAQSITKNRWIHHTSFLWDYETHNMSYLKLPKRAPEYRLARDHLDFICPMKDYLSRSDFISKTIDAAGSHFSLESTKFGAVKRPSDVKFTPTSRLLTNEELEVAASEQTVVSSSHLP